MKTKTLLCIDPLHDYELIDCNLLLQMGIVPLFLIKDASMAIKHQENILVNSFLYEDILNICALRHPDYILCFSEDMFVNIAKIREILNIDGMSLSTAMLLSRKDLMYQKLEGAFPCPKTIPLTEFSSFEKIQGKVASKAIFIKPVNASGSYETWHITTEKAFDHFLTNRKEELENYLAQAYITDAIYHSELAIFDGNILFAEARQYTNPNHLMVSKNLPIFSLNIPDSHKRELIIEASIRTSQLLEFHNGVLHTEFFMNEAGHIQFLETNARPPGIGLNKLYQQKYGLSLETLLCCIVCRVKPPALTENKNHFVCGYFPQKPGVIKQINKPELPVDSEWTFFVKPGDTGEHKKQMSRAAMVLCQAPSMAEVNQYGSYLAELDLIETY